MLKRSETWLRDSNGGSVGAVWSRGVQICGQAMALQWIYVVYMENFFAA